MLGGLFGFLALLLVGLLGLGLYTLLKWLASRFKPVKASEIVLSSGNDSASDSETNSSGKNEAMFDADPTRPVAETPSSSCTSPLPAAKEAAVRLAESKDTILRFGLITFIGLVLLWPLVLVGFLVDERAALYRQVVRDISRTWGGEQEVSGPILVLPYQQRQEVERTMHTADGREEKIKDTHLVQHYFIILPSEVDFSSQLDPQERRRGIYHSLVYTAQTSMKGVFVLPSRTEFSRIDSAMVGVDYDRAYIVVGLSYPSALGEVGAFDWNGVGLTAEPGTVPFTPLESGYRIPVPLDPEKTQYAFKQHLVFNGSGGIRFTPVGKTTTITIASSWPHPSFQGNVLPVSRDITEQGFTASWRVPSLARSYPNVGVLKTWPSSFTAFSIGVDLYRSGGHYQLIERSVKYGVLFIGLTFLAFLVFEVASRSRLHPVQYGLVGLSLVVFYLVLLSLSEHFPFEWAYAAATSCTVLMVSLYVGSVWQNARRGAGIGTLLVALYTLLYAILRMEDYALLMGTGLVVIMLGMLMVVSRNLNEFQGEKR